MTDSRTPDPRADAVVAALERLEKLHLCDSNDYRNPPEYCVEDDQDWPCDTALAVGLARRSREACEWISTHPPLIGDFRCEDCGQFDTDNTLGIERNLRDLQQHKPTCEWAELAATATAAPEDGAGEGG